MSFFVDRTAPQRAIPRSVLLVALATAVALAAYIGLAAHVFGSDPPATVQNALFAGMFVACAAICVIRALRVREEAGPWLAFGLAMLVSAAGWLVYWLHVQQQDPIPYPSRADALWLSGYAVNYVGLLLFMRSRLRTFTGSLWLDGLIGALALAAMSSALVFQPVLDATGGSTAAVAVNLAYPLADLVMLAMIVTMLALSGWRPDRALGLLGAAFSIQVVADSVYLYRSAAGDYVPGTLLDAAWPVALALIACAAWAPSAPGDEAAADSWRRFFAPSLFTGLALGVLLYGNVAETPLLATLFATATLLGVAARGGLRHHEIRQLNRRNETLRGAALSDSLTGLRNHRAFHEDLAVITRANHETPGALVMLDLVGLKLTNDALGHQAGDARLVEFSRAVVSVLRRGDDAYRVGGDEFAVMLRGATAWGGFAFSERVQAAVADSYEGSAPAVSAGIAELAPGMRKDDLIRAADLALIEAKSAARKSVIYTSVLERPRAPGRSAENDRHTKTLATSLARAVDAKDSYTRSHCETVAETCVLIAEKLGLEAERIARLRLAGLLHDVGKIGIPDSILKKPACLTDDEFEVMKTHASLGHDIVLAAGLEDEARWILHHHERLDGRGYPAGLVAEELPLESRVIFVADAFEAMTSDRPYRKGGSVEAAIAELRECSGTQFDPACVEALESALGFSPQRAVAAALPE